MANFENYFGFYQHSSCFACVHVPYDIILGLFMLQKQLQSNLQTITSYVKYGGAGLCILGNARHFLH